MQVGWVGPGDSAVCSSRFHHVDHLQRLLSSILQVRNSPRMTGQGDTPVLAARTDTHNSQYSFTISNQRDCSRDQPASQLQHMPAKLHPCPYCGQVFGKTAHLKYHVRIHLGVQPFECSVCNRHFRSRSNVLQHIRRVHRPDDDANRYVITSVRS